MYKSLKFIFLLVMSLVSPLNSWSLNLSLESRPCVTKLIVCVCLYVRARVCACSSNLIVKEIKVEC